MTQELVTGPAEQMPNSTNAISDVEQIPRLEGRELIAEPNINDADRTLICELNGTSQAVRVKLNNFMQVVPRLPKILEFSLALQKWEGYVTEVCSDTFWARLSPIFGEGSDQDAEIYLEEVDLEDRTLIKPGAVFYWTIGYLNRPSGRQRSSVIRFRRLPVWSKQDLIKARATAQTFKQLFNG